MPKEWFIRGLTNYWILRTHLRLPWQWYTLCVCVPVTSVWQHFRRKEAFMLACWEDVHQCSYVCQLRYGTAVLISRTQALLPRMLVTAVIVTHLSQYRCMYHEAFQNCYFHRLLAVDVANVTTCPHWWRLSAEWHPCCLCDMCCWQPEMYIIESVKTTSIWNKSTEVLCRK